MIIRKLFKFENAHILNILVLWDGLLPLCGFLFVNWSISKYSLQKLCSGVLNNE